LPESPFRKRSVVSKSLAPRITSSPWSSSWATLFWRRERGLRPTPGRPFSTSGKTAIHVPEDCPVAVERLAKGVESSADYQKLKQDYETASPERRPRALREINLRLRDLSAKILAVQNVFTDRAPMSTP